jgi:large subunit ribosomal protein L25
MEDITLTVDKRNILGKKNRSLRRHGITPVHVFGHGIESQSLQCDTHELMQIIAHAGETRLIKLKVKGEKTPKNVFIKEVQKDPFGKELFHVDFYQVRMDEKMEVSVPIILTGESPLMRDKNRMLSHGIQELSISCTPDKVPPQIEVDITVLEDLEQAIFVKDIALDPDITINDDLEQMVVKVAEVGVVEEPEAVAEEEAEAEAAAEVEGEAKAEESGTEAGGEARTEG